MTNRNYTRRKADRSHDAKFVLWLIFTVICTATLFYSIGYERAANRAYEIVKEAPHEQVSR